jgi:CheY-like chemotaxis protein
MSARRAVSVVADLFFATRIATTAKALGVVVKDASPENALELCKTERPDLVILDLHGPGDPLGLARSLKSEESTRHIEIVGFYSHVDQALRHAALAAGVDRVLPRSAFTARLPSILAGNS